MRSIFTACSAWHAVRLLLFAAHDSPWAGCHCQLAVGAKGVCIACMLEQRACLCSAVKCSGSCRHATAKSNAMHSLPNTGDVMKRDAVGAEVEALSSRLAAALREAEAINAQEKMYGCPATK